MKRVVTLIGFMLLAVSLFASVSVSIQAPANGGSVYSPVPVKTSAASSAGHVTYMAIYLDYKKVYGVAASSLSPSITAGTGTHSLIVNAWDSTGAVGKASIKFSVPAATTASNPVVTISTPSDNASTTSPVTVKASATSGTPITYMAVYVDYNKVWGAAVSSLDQQFSLSSGQHSIIVNAWDQDGGSAGAAGITVNVADSTPTPQPSPGLPQTPPAGNYTSVTLSDLANGKVASGTDVTFKANVEAYNTDSNGQPWFTVQDGTGVVYVSFANITIDPTTVFGPEYQFWGKVSNETIPAFQEGVGGFFKDMVLTPVAMNEVAP